MSRSVWWKRGITVLAISLGLILIGPATHGSVLARLGQILVYEDRSFEQADLAVVPPGSVPDRAPAAADLFQKSRVKKVVLTRDPESPEVKQLAELGISFPDHLAVNRMVLLKKDVPPDRILELPGESTSTWEDAGLLRDYLESESLHSVVIVTCRYHSRRAYLNYRKALQGLNIEVFSVPSRYCRFEPESWWKDRDAIVMTYVELAKLGAFYLGWA